MEVMEVMEVMEGKVERLWIKRAHRGVMDAAAEVELVAGLGVRGSANFGTVRQVTIISREAFERMAGRLQAPVDPAARRADLMISGLDLRDSRGRVLALGAARVRVRGETRPCERMDDAQPGLRAVMRDDWNGGVHGEVLDGGAVRVGDTAAWVAEDGA